jgi:hypothetical protein
MNIFIVMGLVVVTLLIGIPLLSIYLTKEENRLIDLFNTNKFFYVTATLSLLFWVAAQYLSSAFYVLFCPVFFFCLAWVRLSKW